MSRQRMIGMVVIALSLLCSTARADEWFIPDTGNDNVLNTWTTATIGHFNMLFQNFSSTSELGEESDASSTASVSGTAGSAVATASVAVGPYHNSTLSVAGEVTHTIAESGWGGVRGRTTGAITGTVFGVIASDTLDPDTPVDLLVTVTMEWSSGNGTLTTDGNIAATTQYAMLEADGVVTDSVDTYEYTQSNGSFAQYDFPVNGIYAVGQTVRLEVFQMESLLTNAVTTGDAIVSFTIAVTIVEQ